MDEFVLSWPFAYVKTARADEEAQSLRGAKTANLSKTVFTEEQKVAPIGDVSHCTAEAFSMPNASDCKDDDTHREYSEGKKMYV